MSSKENDEQQRRRFQIELEFVQCLANPNYLNYLAQRGFLKDKSFINYLNYLRYWKKPEYSKYLKYPMCLHFLDLLQYEHFRKEITNGQCAKFIEDQQLLHWQHYIRKRTRLLQTAAGSDASAPTTGSTGKPTNASSITSMLTGTTSQVSAAPSSTTVTLPSSLGAAHSTLSNGTTFASLSANPSSNSIMAPNNIQN